MDISFDVSEDLESVFREAVKEEIESSEVDIECPECGKTITVHSGANVCPVCNQEISCHFDLPDF